jgi:hypothetical protein
MVLKLETAKSFIPLTTLLVILLTAPTTAFTALPTYLPIQLKNPMCSQNLVAGSPPFYWWEESDSSTSLLFIIYLYPSNLCTI